jgi:hypothetical protein
MALSLRVVFCFSGIGSPSGLGLKEDEKLLKGKDRWRMGPDQTQFWKFSFRPNGFQRNSSNIYMI